MRQLCRMELSFRLCHLFLSILSIGLLTESQEQTSVEDIIFVVLSQSGSVHVPRANDFHNDITEQVHKLKWKTPKIFQLHRDFSEIGMWTIFPLLKKLDYYHGTNNSWIFICEEGTKVNVEQLVVVLGRYDKTKEWFLGRALHDDFATIVHHFAFHENPVSFKYPDFAAGFILSGSLIRKMVPKMDNYTRNLDFSIDAQHEFAMFLHNEGNGTALNDVAELCVSWARYCASYYTLSKIQKCNGPAHMSNVFFAVKSCQQHEDRVPVILNTWAADKNLQLGFFSDTKNRSYPVVDLGIPNTLKGHCSKTMGIINHVAKEKEFSNVSWLVIADDDTLLSVPRMLSLLGCYNAKEKIALGQRYGFRTASQEGYDYLTGGASMVLSATAVGLVAKHCVCPAEDTPDDMFLGMCLKRLGIRLTNSPHFHQARPNDYSYQLLAHREPISFHKFWMVNPYEVYEHWLQEKPLIAKPAPRQEL